MISSSCCHSDVSAADVSYGDGRSMTSVLRDSVFSCDWSSPQDDFGCSSDSTSVCGVRCRLTVGLSGTSTCVGSSEPSLHPGQSCSVMSSKSLAAPFSRKIAAVPSLSRNLQLSLPLFSGAALNYASSHGNNVVAPSRAEEQSPRGSLVLATELFSVCSETLPVPRL